MLGRFFKNLNKMKTKKKKLLAEKAIHFEKIQLGEHLAIN